MLLLRVRDEAQMTISAYETLYESSIAFGVRKALVAEQKKMDLAAKKKELMETNKELQEQVESLRSSIELTLSRTAQSREAEEHAHTEEVSKLPNINIRIIINIIIIIIIIINININ